MKVSVLMPIYNDWDSLRLITPEIIHSLAAHELDIYAINDCSSIPFPSKEFEKFSQLKVLNLVRNLGHQKAIAIGLSYLAEINDADCIVVMDGDGEDKPSDLPVMIEHFIISNGNKIIFAHRRSRKEGFVFQAMYRTYKLIFKLLTGRSISFGNFCVIPPYLLQKIVYVSEIWNHFSGGVIRSKLPYSTISIEKGNRVSGESKMNMVSLVIHGISSVAVHLDVVSVRLLLFTSILISFSFISLLIVVYIRLFTDIGIPGWATYTFIGLGSIILQAFFICLLLTFMVLFYRSQRQFIPANEYRLFLENEKNT